MDEDLLNSINEVTLGSSAAAPEPAPGSVSGPSFQPAQPQPQSQPVQPVQPQSQYQSQSRPVSPAPQTQIPVQNNSNETLSKPAQSPEPVFKQKKSVSKTTIILIVVAILALIGVGVAALFATGIIGGKPGNTPAPSYEEKQLDDATKLSEINRKLNILFGVSSDSESIAVNSADFDDVYLFLNRDLTEEQKIWRAINSLSEDNAKALSAEELASAQSVWAASGAPVEFVPEAITAYAGGVVASTYLDLYGSELQRFVLESNRIQYDEEYDFYFKISSLETTVADTRYYYRGEYTEMGDDIFVYISGGQLDAASGNVYCDVFPLPYDGTLPEVCATATSADTFTIDDTNSGYFTLRMFKFSKSTDGGYYFVGASRENLPPVIYPGADDTTEDTTDDTATDEPTVDDSETPTETTPSDETTPTEGEYSETVEIVTE